MNQSELAAFYRAYIDCLNRRDWDLLGRFVHPDVSHNGRRIGLAGYRTMLERDHHEIPDLRFSIEILAVDPPRVASRLAFDCTPVGTFLGLPVDGRRIRFAENVFYELREGTIVDVRSILDKAAIELQLATTAPPGAAEPIPGETETLRR
ncbi:MULTISPECIES: ester cyclase [unclassified Aureimonas]|uniref:ester cyclase n=1 Tax=unclassified Aureimonas TaxID=2615206 RepID=UPI0006FCF33C|nr:MULTISPECIES: ester cyclase [unclassified Aureimonas]KQT65902.1 ester cyclase [Aureimonas sp. Leaf427]KQT73261.1 ester cyclase [Aureimonas sp. Leaf460]